MSNRGDPSGKTGSSVFSSRRRSANQRLVYWEAFTGRLSKALSGYPQQQMLGVPLITHKDRREHETWSMRGDERRWRRPKFPVSGSKTAPPPPSRPRPLLRHPAASLVGLYCLVTPALFYLPLHLSIPRPIAPFSSLFWLLRRLFLYSSPLLIAFAAPLATLSLPSGE